MTPRLAFLGTPEFARVALQSLCDNGFKPAVVYTQPPRPAGRGMELQKSPVALYAESQNIPVLHPKSLKSAEAQAEFKNFDLDLAIVAAYGLILPQAVLDAPKMGCLNIHASLLPKWRGAAPIQRTILAGDIETGITLMRMDAGLDTGEIYASESTIIGLQNAGQLHDSLADLGARMMVQYLPEILSGKLPSTPQPEIGVTYAEKIKKEEARIDWKLPAIVVERHIRAFNPFPGAYFEYNGERIKILSAIIDGANSGKPGEIMTGLGLSIACGQDAIQPLILQRPGKKAVSVNEFLRGFTLPVGKILL